VEYVGMWNCPTQAKGRLEWATRPTVPGDVEYTVE
jgi:hypothetical protein